MSNLAGTIWVLNENISFPDEAITILGSGINDNFFTSNDTNFSRIKINTGAIIYSSEHNNTWGHVPVYSDHWSNENYRTITFTKEPTSFSPSEEAFIEWLEYNTTRHPSQYYITNDLELGDIADAIRTKLGRDANTLGKNLLNPETMIAYVQPNTTYTLSVTITWDGKIDSLGGFNKYFLNNVAGGGFFDIYNPPPAAATERETTIINTGNNCYAIKINFNEDLDPMDAQLELGSIATEYEPYTSSNSLSYPTDFTNKILNTANLVHVNGAMSECTYYPSDTNKTILQSGTYIGANQIVAAVQHLNLEAANIKAGTNVKVYSQSISSPIYNITGTYTSDATATATDIIAGKTAYVNGEKITGTYQGSSSSPVSFSTYIDCNNSSGTCSASRYFKLETFSNFYEQLASKIGCSSSKINVNKMYTGDTSGIVVNRFYGQSNITLYILNTTSSTISIPSMVRVYVEGYYTP